MQQYLSRGFPHDLGEPCFCIDCRDPKYFYFAQDGSYGDAKGLLLVKVSPTIAGKELAKVPKGNEYKLGKHLASMGCKTLEFRVSWFSVLK